MEHKRITLLAGHYGSGKTNIALNLAFLFCKEHNNVAIADLDIVNPYFRTNDSKVELEQAGIRLICSQYASSNIDVPALPQELYAITDDRSICAVMDIGGDDRGAFALGRFAPAIVQESDYEMLFVINKYRPLTKDADSTIEIMREIEKASGIRFSAIVNNSNLGEQTTIDDVLSSVSYANEISKKTGLKIKLTTVTQDIFPQLSDSIPNLFPLRLQKKII